MKTYRTEHPTPDFFRKDWICLNGEWEFEKDNSLSGRARGLPSCHALKEKINVPFCPESVLSGIGDTDFMYCVWYRKEISISLSDLGGKRAILHFGACDYRSEVWINGVSCGKHTGGFTPFSFDITPFISNGKNTITVCAEDRPQDPMQPVGKQSEAYASYGCHYTRVTGIWQTVWLEFVPESHILSYKVYADISSCSVTLMLSLAGHGDLYAEAYYDGRLCGSASARGKSGSCALTIPLSEEHLWEIGHGRLYDLVLKFGDDEVRGYFGLREVALEDGVFKLNGKPCFMRLVLDQGYYQDGIWTAKDDEALKADILLAQAAGFNGARLHQKVFEPRFLYHCDKLGYIVWGEYGSWGLDCSDAAALCSILPEWCDELERDFNHPSIIGWCPLNETWTYGKQKKFQCDDVIRITYETTKRLDPTRPCIDTSGGVHVKSDIYDFHAYEQNSDRLREKLSVIEMGETPCERFKGRDKWNGEALFISEYGGTGIVTGGDSWSYGQSVSNSEELIERYSSLTRLLLENPHLTGFCYTQLYDVEQEQNGLYTYTRKPKADIDRIREINTSAAAIEDPEK